MNAKRTLLVLLLLCSVAAQADEPGQVPKPNDSSYTFSFGNVFSGITLDFVRYGVDESVSASGLGVYVRPSRRLNRFFQIDVEGDLTPIEVLDFSWRVASTFGYSPVNAFTVAIGPTGGGFRDNWTRDRHGGFIGGTVRVDWHPFATVNHRHLTCSLSGDLGKSIAAGFDFGNEGPMRLAYGYSAMVGYTF